MQKVGTASCRAIAGGCLFCSFHSKVSCLLPCYAVFICLRQYFAEKMFTAGIKLIVIFSFCGRKIVTLQHYSIWGFVNNDT